MLIRDGVTRVVLDGLQTAEARALVAEIAPDVDAAFSDRLIEHVGGNPLHLRALLAEHDPGELAEMEQLPAPDELTESTARRLSGVPPDAARLVRATAVLGTGWSSVALAGAVADIEDATSAAATGGTIGLLERREPAGMAQVRIVHAVLQSAVLAGMSVAERRRLHLRAAGTGLVDPHLVSATGARRPIVTTVRWPTTSRPMPRSSTTVGNTARRVAISPGRPRRAPTRPFARHAGWTVFSSTSWSATTNSSRTR